MVKLEKGSSSDQTERLVFALSDYHRYATLGSLVKGIIHNLNGSLQVLSMHMELLEKMLKGKEKQFDSQIRNKMGQCLRQVDKFKSIIEELSLKARRDEQDTPQPIEINEIFEECFSLYHHDLFFKHQIKLVRNLSPHLPSIEGLYMDFHQGFSNLIQNAIEAMEGMDRKELTVETHATLQYVQVTVKDTGMGISEETKPFLFAPFFTTKSGKHNGLGLFIAKELLTPYGALFNHTSRQGETSFSATFPLRPGVSSPSPKRSK